jgi:hypothetical protein
LDLLFPCPDSRFDCKRRSRRLLIDVKGSLGRDCIASIYLFIGRKSSVYRVEKPEQ